MCRIRKFHYLGNRDAAIFCYFSAPFGSLCWQGRGKCGVCGRRTHATKDCPRDKSGKRFSSSQKSEPVRLPRGAQTAGSSSVTSPLLQQSHLPQFPVENNAAVCVATSGPSTVNPQQQLEYSHQLPPPLLPFPGTTQHAIPLPTCPAVVIEEADPCALPCCEDGDDFESLVQALEASVHSLLVRTLTSIPLCT